MSSQAWWHLWEISPLPLAGEVGLSGPGEGIRVRILPPFEQESAPSPAAETATSPPKGERLHVKSKVALSI